MSTGESASFVKIPILGLKEKQIQIANSISFGRWRTSPEKKEDEPNNPGCGHLYSPCYVGCLAPSNITKLIVDQGAFPNEGSETQQK